MRRRTLNILLAAAVLAIAWPARGQTPPAAAAPARPTPRISAVRATAKIAVDGRLDEADWARAAPAKDFLQKDPDEGKPATEPTEVRILYDDDAIYVGARMFDSRAVEDREAPDAAGRRHRRHRRLDHRRPRCPSTTS